MNLYSVYKIIPGQRAAWAAWCSELMTTHLIEARETLREENLTRESAVAFDFDGAQYVIFTHTSPSKKLPATSRELNKKHFEMMNQCLEKVGEASFGYDISV